MLQVLMIIKGLFRRYERWNPVHPTSGALWGIGIGFGCGVGWGPGFGPEVIGYVGAGCGVGFSVGITLLGFGLGLPANFIYQGPYKAFMATRSGAMGIAHSSGLPEMKNVALDGWSNMGLHISGVKEKASQSFINFRQKQCMNGRVDLPDVRTIMSSHSKSIQDCLKKFQNHIHPPKGFKD
ncbi:cadmium-induced protein AS8 isoform X3 [Daucus carota subsp. sativus]|uniref:cadmium-induced protein AS8 isoform X3 n=1 Tax=Daucus carota subsp. sativus TaxID=79200 RepID=UPI0007F0240A|nr:PREDICTED: cadmium-induced protein AS8 isoform X3 [Daucus carota subsp. sativus]